MKRSRLITCTFVIVLLVALGGCQLLGNAPEGPSATPIAESFPSPPPTLEATALAAVTVEAVSTATGAGVATEPPPPTLPPATTEAIATEPPPPTPTEAAPDATDEPAVEATASSRWTVASCSPPASRTPRRSPPESSKRTRSAAQRFTPIVLFVDPENTLDVTLAAYSGDLSAPGCAGRRHAAVGSQQRPGRAAGNAGRQPRRRRSLHLRRQRRRILAAPHPISTT